ncbi:MAG: hypothetical protein WAW06_06960 [bacterium]
MKLKATSVGLASGGRVGGGRPEGRRAVDPRSVLLRWLLASAVILVGILSGERVVADESSGASSEQSPRDLIYAYKVWKLTDVLDLSDEQLPVFFSKIKRIDEKEAEAGQGERDAIKRVARLLEDAGARDEDLAAALRSLDEARARRSEEIRSLRQDALSMLTARQRAKYVVFEEDFREEMRQMIGRAREMRRGERDTEGGEGGNRDERSGQQRGGGGGTGRGSGGGNGNSGGRGGR